MRSLALWLKINHKGNKSNVVTNLCLQRWKVLGMRKSLGRQWGGRGGGTCMPMFGIAKEEKFWMRCEKMLDEVAIMWNDI